MSARLPLLLLLACGAKDDPAQDSEGDSASDSPGDSAADTGPADADGDGWAATEDCDDADPAVNPGAEELCGNGVDDDCDPSTDCHWSGEHLVSEASFALYGEGNAHQLGHTAAFVPDVDGDGRDELALQVISEWDGWETSDAACVRIWFGGRSEDSLESEADMLGCSASGQRFTGDFADLDGDGVVEMLLNHDRGAAGYVELGRLGEVALDEGLVRLAPEDAEAVITTAGVWRGVDGADWLILGKALSEDADRLRLYRAPVLDDSYEAPTRTVMADETWRELLSARPDPVGDLDGDGLASVAFTGVDVSRPEDAETGGIAILDGLPPDGAAFVDAIDRVVWGRGEDSEEGYDHHGGARLMVQPSGDLDGDGYADLLLSDRVALVEGVYGPGCALLFPGPLGAETELSEAAVRVCGGAESFRVARYADASGDIDGDGAWDLLLGESALDDEGFDEGRVHVFHGPIAPGAYSAGEGDARISGAAAGHAAHSPRSGGDFDGDGVQDFLIGGHLYSELESGAGAAWVFLGGGI
ncbi:MAG: putative metal-binding motif-containing protein [Alphaproteobacteria bacterium]|nr:putative metal-binding motif-containing protein [Alphaproteobacteria bacterium]